MNNCVEYKELMAFHPGYYIEEIIDSMGISQAEFATRLGTTPKTLSQLLNGQANISNDLAKKLATMLGTSVDVWQNLQNTFDKKIIEIEQIKDLDEQEFITRLLDYSYFMKNAGLPKTNDVREKTKNLCSFLKIADLRILTKPEYLVNYKTNSTTDNDTQQIINSRAWIQTAINMSDSVITKPYDSAKLRSFLPEFRKMASHSPVESAQKIKNLLAESGVAFVLLCPFKNPGVDGAVKWMNDSRAILAMNNKGDDIGKFWFSFFHEIRHILQKKLKTLFVDNSTSELSYTNVMLEKDADRFAQDFLISPAEYSKFSPSSMTTIDEILSFADSINVHPSIVVGRLQHDGIISKTKGNKLKESYSFTTSCFH